MKASLAEQRFFVAERDDITVGARAGVSEQSDRSLRTREDAKCAPDGSGVSGIPGCFSLLQTGSHESWECSGPAEWMRSVTRCKIGNRVDRNERAESCMCLADSISNKAQALSEIWVDCFAVRGFSGQLFSKAGVAGWRKPSHHLEEFVGAPRAPDPRQRFLSRSSLCHRCQSCQHYDHLASVVSVLLRRPTIRTSFPVD